jgi:DNA topoisomerase-2
MCYNPLQIIEYLKNKLLSIENNMEFIPYYEGFKGAISKITDDKFLIKGVYEKLGNDKIRITELPIGYWTEDFKELLESLIECGLDKDGKKIQSVIKDYDDMSKDTNVDFTITFMKGKLDDLESSKSDYGCNGVEKILKLFTTNTTTNMHLFDANDKLQKYDKICEIIDTYYDVRLKMYLTRKNYMIDALEKELVLLNNKAKYIKENLDGTIDLRKKKREEVICILEEKQYDKINGDEEYKYLIKMPMDSVTQENIDKLLKDKENKEYELETVKDKTVNKMWIEELDNVKEQYTEYKNERNNLMSGEHDNEKSSKKKVISKGSVKKVVKKCIIEDE